MSRLRGPAEKHLHRVGQIHNDTTLLGPGCPNFLFVTRMFYESPPHHVCYTMYIIFTQAFPFIPMRAIQTNARHNTDGSKTSSTLKNQPYAGSAPPVLAVPFSSEVLSDFAFFPLPGGGG